VEIARIARACAAMAVALFLLTLPAAAESVSYDLENCTTDTGGRVFVRLMNGQSFAFPAEDLLFLRGEAGWPDEWFADPDQPAGCPLHPITSKSLVVRYSPVTPRHPAEPPGERWRPDLLQLVTNPYGGGAHLIQGGNLRKFDSACINKPADNPRRHRLVDVSPALQECRFEQPDTKDDGDLPSFLAAKPGAHPEYEGLRFAVRCTYADRPGGSRTCEAYYRMQGDLGIMYRFEDALVQPAHMAEFDLQIRAFVEASRTQELDVATDR
jgi:hypothetical protein